MTLQSTICVSLKYETHCEMKINLLKKKPSTPPKSCLYLTTCDFELHQFMSVSESTLLVFMDEIQITYIKVPNLHLHQTKSLPQTCWLHSYKCSLVYVWPSWLERCTVGSSSAHPPEPLFPSELLPMQLASAVAWDYFVPSAGLWICLC